MVAWQWKGVSDRWKKMPTKALNSTQDWMSWGPGMSDKLQTWWDDENRPDDIKLSPNGLAHYKFVKVDVAPNGALLRSGGKAACSILVKRINVCVMGIEDVVLVDDELVRVTFQMGMSGNTWFTQTCHKSLNWRMFLTNCMTKMEDKLTRPEMKFVKILRADGSFVDMAQFPKDEQSAAVNANVMRRPAAKSSASRKRPASKNHGNKSKKGRRNLLDPALKEGERKKYLAGAVRAARPQVSDSLSSSEYYASDNDNAPEEGEED